MDNNNNYYGNICYCRKCNGIVHTIKKGDSLYLLSRYYNVPIGEIMSANRNMNVYNLQIGEEICIPIRRQDMMNDSFVSRPDTNNGQNMNNASTNNNSPTNTGQNMADMMDIPNMDDAVNYSDIESTCVETTEENLFTSDTKLSDLVSREDMTLEKFRSIMQNI